MKNLLPKPPKTLSKEGKALWRKLVAEYSITDAAGLTILATALEAIDRLRQAQAAIEKNGGPIIIDRFGQPKQHPATLIERDARNQMLAAFKQLHWDLEPLRDGPGRPPLTGA